MMPDSASNPFVGLRPFESDESAGRKGHDRERLRELHSEASGFLAAEM